MYFLSGGQHSTIFEELEDSKGFRIQPQYKFHLYINTAPCGDARIFAPHEEEADRTDRHPNRQSRGLLRTKIESGEGTIPIKVIFFSLLLAFVLWFYSFIDVFIHGIAKSQI